MSSSTSTGRAKSSRSRIAKLPSSTEVPCPSSDVKNGTEESQVIESAEDSQNSGAIENCQFPNPYQYRGVFEIDYSLNSDKGLRSRSELTRTHRTMRLGLGTPLNNLKTTHLVNSKKTQSIPIPMRKIVPGCINVTKVERVKKSADLGRSLASNMKKLTIYESPDKEESHNQLKRPSIFDTAFKSLDRKANLLALGHKVDFYIDGKVIPMNGFDKNDKYVMENKKKSRVSSKDGGQEISNLCRHFRSLLGWKMSLHLRWKYIEDRVLKWPEKLAPVTVDEIAELLKITGDQLRLFQISPDLKEVFHVLRKNICHVNTPNIAKILALSELQQGNSSAAARYLAEVQGMFLHSDIIDKHLNYIRRNEEAIVDSPRSQDEKERDSFKLSLFSSQVKDTLTFTDQFFETKKGEATFIKKLSSFDPNWNIVQISTSVQATNRFSNHIIGKRQVPQIILSAFCHTPGVSSRCEFTTFCQEPHVDVGSMMRHGLVEEFQKVLDNNLAISDECTVVSRRKYWEERAKHNLQVEGIMMAMEEWLNPWTFLLPGRIKNKTIQDLIKTEILSHKTLKHATNSQKLLICRLTENYEILPRGTRFCLGTLVSYILQIDEETAKPLAKKMEETSLAISSGEPRYPTILILDQEIDVLPWDWIPCLRTTDVTRMPSLSLINSSNNMNKKLKSTYPVIVQPDKCTFILNPDGTLPNVQVRMEDYLKGRKEWLPIVGRSPTSQEMQDTLQNQDLLLYCGHGAGSSYYPEYAVQKLVCRAVPLLMGCSSAQSHYTGPRLYANSVVNTYFIAGCPSVVGFLWEVTDTECDRLTVDLLERWLPNTALDAPIIPFSDIGAKREKEKYLPTALRKSRTAATQLLTQCAAVCYGLPVATIDS